MAWANCRRWSPPEDRSLAFILFKLHAAFGHVEGSWVTQRQGTGAGGVVFPKYRVRKAQTLRAVEEPGNHREKVAASRPERAKRSPNRGAGVSPVERQSRGEARASHLHLPYRA